MAFVFLDRVVECEPGQRVVALKALAYNEEHFRDHFPGMPVMPGAMILEGLAQAARHCLAAAPEGNDHWGLAEVAQARFLRLAVPGEVIRLEAQRDREEGDVVWFRGLASVGDESACRLRFAMRPLPVPGFDAGGKRA
ncbi:MAG TPA: 3-hydroxyacyl-ACP dehydratase FabZ family protein [Vicinamibacteria bacterium]|jgi:3-hydroxyacyl-[acyl-carrier-protein] dehydratase